MWLEYDSEELERLERIADYIAKSNELIGSFLREEIITSIQSKGGVEEAILLGHLACCVIILIEQGEQAETAIRHLIDLSRLHAQVGKMIECSHVYNLVAESAPDYLSDTTEANEVFVSDMMFHLYRQHAEREIREKGINGLADFILGTPEIWKERTRWIARTILLDAIKQCVDSIDDATQHRIRQIFAFDPYLTAKITTIFKTQ